MTVATRPKVYSKFRCAVCGRRLKNGHYVYSRFTGNRYCSTSRGCRK